MKKVIVASKFVITVGVSLILIMSSIDAFAANRGRDGNKNRDNDHRRDFGHDRGRSHEVVIINRQRYSYHDGRFYRPSWFGFEIALATAPFGAIVVSLPIGNRAVIVGGAQYYYYDNIYYKPCPSGYIVVPAPAVVANPAQVVVLPQSTSGETVTINIPNSNGSFTPITLVKKDNGYIGPQGEYYSSHPTVEQLKALYGK